MSDWPNLLVPTGKRSPNSSCSCRLLFVQPRKNSQIWRFRTRGLAPEMPIMQEVQPKLISPPTSSNYYSVPFWVPNQPMCFNGTLHCNTREPDLGTHAMAVELGDGTGARDRRSGDGGFLTDRPRFFGRKKKGKELLKNCFVSLQTCTPY